MFGISNLLKTGSKCVENVKNHFSTYGARYVIVSGITSACLVACYVLANQEEPELHRIGGGRVLNGEVMTEVVTTPVLNRLASLISQQS